MKIVQSIIFLDKLLCCKNNNNNKIVVIIVLGIAETVMYHVLALKHIEKVEDLA